MNSIVQNLNYLGVTPRGARFEVLNTAELAEVCLIFAKFQNLVTLAFCTLFAMIQKKGCHEILILVTFTLTLGIY